MPSTRPDRCHLPRCWPRSIILASQAANLVPVRPKVANDGTALRASASIRASEHAYDREGFGDPPAGRLRPGLRVYAMGDIHGRADLLGRMAAMIEADLAKTRPARRRDRVRRRLHRPRARVRGGDRSPGAPRFPDADRHLARQSRTDADRQARGVDGRLRNWLFNGGLETAESYGLVSTALWRPGCVSPGPSRRHAGVPSRVSAQHRAQSAVDGYFFCHAGIEPGVPLDRQQPENLLWIRGAFHPRADHGKVMVHGHTPVAKPGVAGEPDQHRHRGVQDGPAHLPGAGRRDASLLVDLKPRPARPSSSGGNHRGAA